jgi:hypothetical protein
VKWLYAHNASQYRMSPQWKNKQRFDFMVNELFVPHLPGISVATFYV